MSARIYHVAKQGNDKNCGSADTPFLTIQRAAELALAGDRVIVHEGEYREWVKPRNGGISDTCRIVYEAAEGEHVVIKGSEIITGWERGEGTVWRKKLPNAMFGEYNPFAVELMGDWIVDPVDKPVHLGEVYLNGKSLYEAQEPEQVFFPVRWDKSPYHTWGDREEKVLEPELTLYRWFARVEEEETVLTVNFQEKDPNEELVEINVRQSCFYPDRIGINYITVRGFEMAHAATPWAPPTADQPGLIGPHWSKGWIIEENDIHDAKCSGVSLGKEASTGDNDFTRWRKKPGYQYQMEAVFRARHIGWSRERIGSHIVRNNKIHDCGQNGIVGHMGCVFSEIYGNEIYNIAVKHEFYGHEIAGIKLHAAIDVRIHHNYIHNCTLGTWLDWQAQGTRVSSNLYDQNNRDFMIEVTHGPALVDNNIFTSEFTFVNAAQGTAFVHNLCGGFADHYPCLDRATPYHLPHSTEVLGTALVYGNDDRWYQNIFIGGELERKYGTGDYSGAPVSHEEYIDRVRAHGNGDVEYYQREMQPAYIDGNVYFKDAPAFDREEHKLQLEADPQIRIVREGREVYLETVMPEELFKEEVRRQLDTKLITTEFLGNTRITEGCYENPDGTPVRMDVDLVGNRRGVHPVPGPLQSLLPGCHKVKICSLGERTGVVFGESREGLKEKTERPGGQSNGVSPACRGLAVDVGVRMMAAGDWLATD